MCPNIIPSQKADDCCAGHRAGDCGAPAPEKSTDAPCTKLAISADHVIPAVVQMATPAVMVETPEMAPAAVVEAAPDVLLTHSPPELYLLNATLLI
jgi:hypothetical protein